MEEDLRRTIRLSGEIQREAEELLRVIRRDESYFDESALQRRIAQLGERLDARDSDVGIWSSVIRAIVPWWRRFWIRPRPVLRGRDDRDN